jgi:O-antigen/teichoic acid export membrane protein
MTTGSLPDSLSSRTARGAGWMLAWRASTRIIGLFSTLILVRLLAPSDFGLIALATSCVFIVDAVAFIGVEDSLVREKEPSRAMLDTAFTLNVIRAAASALVVALLAVPAAGFLGEPALIPLMLLLAGMIAAEGFGNIGTVAFRRTLAFDKVFRLELVPRLASVSLTLLLAVLWRSYWALIVGIIVQRLLRAALSYAMHDYRPRFSLAAWRALAGFSAWAWAITLANQVRERSESILIGHLADTHQVGLYETGKEIALLPTSELIHPACHAVYSGFALSRNAGDDPADSCLRVIGILVLLSLPAGFGLSAIAAPLVRLAFGANWLDSIPVLQAFGVASAASGFGFVCSTLLRAHGLMRLSFRISIVSVPVRIALLLILMPMGGIAITALGIAVAAVLGRIGTLIVTFRHFGIRFAELGQRVWRAAIGLCVMCGVLWWSGLGWTLAPPHSAVACALQIAAAIGAAAIAYGGTVFTLWLLSGRPAGAETDSMDLVARAVSRPLRRGQNL